MNTPAFDNQMRPRLAAFSIDDTALNRQKAKEALFEGRSAAFFDWQ